MQRTWIRALIFVAVSAVSGLATSEAEAQGPVRRFFRRAFGRDNVVTTRSYIDANGNRVMVRDGFTYSTPGRVSATGRVDASGRWIAPLDRTARGGTRVETRFDGQASPATRIEADANVRTPGGANVRGGANARGDADFDRSGGSTRGNADLRGNVTPPESPATPEASDATLPPPVPTP
jgi:hypothetical protein